MNKINSIIFNNINILEQDNYYKINNYNINITKNNINIKDLKKKYITNNTNKIIILKENNKVEVLLIGEKNIKYIYNDIKLFNQIYIPELINLYLNDNIIEKEQEKIINNNKYYCINNNFYILNYNIELFNYLKEYIIEINKNNNYKIEINKDYLKEDNNINKEKEIVHSYGYINILLISFIITIITIIYCISRYY